MNYLRNHIAQASVYDSVCYTEYDNILPLYLANLYCKRWRTSIVYQRYQ